MAYAENYLERDKFPETRVFVEGSEGSVILDLDSEPLTPADLEARRGMSSYFNGDALRVRMYAGPLSKRNQFSIKTVGVSKVPAAGPATICGADDRTLSTDRRVARIVWRVVVGHPGPNERQRGLFFELGKWTHYILMVALGGMLLSGPAMAWASGTDIVVFDWFEIAAASEPLFALRDTLHIVHRSCAIVIFVGVILHIGGVYKHTAFNHDGTFIRIILPSKE